MYAKQKENNKSHLTRAATITLGFTVLIFLIFCVVTIFIIGCLAVLQL